MEDPEYKGLTMQFAHDITFDENKSFNKRDLKRSEPANVAHRCSCSICYLQSKNKIDSHHSYSNARSDEYSKQSRGFTWLLEKLGEISTENICKLNIPDTAVFRKGKAVFFMQYQRDRSLKCISSSEKLTNHEIVKNIINIVRNRKKEETLYKTGKLRPSSIGIQVEYSKETACIKYMSKGRDNELEEVLSKDENGATRVMTESEFTELMWERSGSVFWKTVAYIQSVLKCRKGIGESFVYSYDFDRVDSAQAIRAGLEDNEEYEEQLYLENTNKYFEYIFMKLYYYFEKYLSLMILHIKGEFVRDDNNRIWLINASDIDFVPIAKIEDSKSIEIPQLQAKFDEDQLLNHLAQAARQPKNNRTEAFSKVMNKECEKMIDASKIMDIFKPDAPDVISTAAFTKLRRFTPYNLEDLLNAKKAEKLLKTYTENKRKNRKGSCEIKGIDYDTHIATQTGQNTKKLTNTWIFTPKIRISPTKTQRRPQSSTVYRLSANSSRML